MSCSGSLFKNSSRLLWRQKMPGWLMWTLIVLFVVFVVIPILGAIYSAWSGTLSRDVGDGGDGDGDGDADGDDGDD